MSYKTYILYSALKTRYYIGHTQDLVDRLERHNSYRTKSTKYGVPWELVWFKEFTTRSEAMQLEKQIKKRGAKRFLDEQ